MNRPPRLLPLLLALTLAACGGDVADAPGTPDAEADAGATPDAPGAPADDAAEPPADAPADVPAGTDPLDLGDGEAALASYTLSMERLEGWRRASQNLQRLGEEDPALAETWQSENADTGSINDMIRRMEAEPRVRRAVEDAGISVRDYVLTTFAIVQAMFAQAAVEAGQPMPEGVNPANVAFVREHQAEIQAMFQEMQAEAQE
jgi:hypothetical protein